LVNKKNRKKLEDLLGPSKEEEELRQKLVKELMTPEERRQYEAEQEEKERQQEEQRSQRELEKLGLTPEEIAERRQRLAEVFRKGFRPAQ
jgi:hypothetical protein